MDIDPPKQHDTGLRKTVGNMITILITKEMMILKTLKNLNNIKKYQIFCINLIIFNILAFFFTSYTQDENMTYYWYCSYGDLFREIFGPDCSFDWILNLILDLMYFFSWFVFLLTGILYVFKKKNRRFLIANIILQTLGILTQIVDLWGNTLMFSSHWWYGDTPWVKTFGYLLNLIFGILLYRYYKKYQENIDRTSFKYYYVACIICIILSFALGELYGYIWSNYLDPTRNWDDDYSFLYIMQYLS